MPFPKCFQSQEQYDLWSALAGETDVQSICWDCSPNFQKAMLRNDRCEQPATVFIEITDWDEDEPEVVGVPQ